MSYTGSSITGGQSFTFSFWMKTDQDLNPYLDYIFAEGGTNSSGIQTGIDFFFHGNSKDLGILHPAVSLAGILRCPFPGIEQWHHVVVTGPVTYRVYIDGQLMCTGSSQYVPIADNCTLTIGAFNGAIDDFSIFNRQLSFEEIQTIYTASSNGGDDTGGTGGGGTTSTTTAPPGIPYQAEVRDDNGEVLANTSVNVRFTLHELTANGTVSYQETHALTTNELGLFAATIGAGTATQGTFAGINWSQTTKFLQVEVDTGNGYITMGNQQLMSVPYALYAANSQQGPQGPAGEPGPAGPQGPQGASAPATNGSFNHYIGERFGGGIVFHVFRDTLGEEHGLIVAKQALAYGPFCICAALENFDNPTNSFDGKHNTEALLTGNLFSQGAISLVSDFSGNGFDDWYLPSIDEVELLMSKGYALKSSGFQFLSPQLSDFTPFRWNMVLSSTITNPGSNILMWTGTGTEGSWGINYQIPQGEGNILAVRKF